MRDQIEGESGGAVPWASVFDPVANVVALGDIPARGLRAASEVIDRLVAAVDGAEQAPQTPTTGTRAQAAAPGGDNGHLGPTQGGGRQGTVEGPGPLIDAWTRLIGRGLDAVAQIASSATRTEESATIDVTRVGGALPLRLAPSADGEARGDVWLHNSGTPLHNVCLHVSELRHPDGQALPACAVKFDPARIDELHSRSSRGIRVTATFPPSAIPGTYRGTILASGAPNVWLPLELVVGSGSGVR